MRISLVNGKLAVNRACTLQISHHYRSFADIIVPVVGHNFSSSCKRKAHVAPICDSLVKGKISLVSQMVQAVTMVHEPSIKRMFSLITIVQLGAAY